MEVTADHVDLVSGQLWDVGVVAVEELPGEEGRVLLRTSPAEAEGMGRVVAAVADHPGVYRHRLVAVDDELWLDAWRDHARAEPAGERLWIQPSWLPPVDPPAGRVVVRNDPGRAFGSGSHVSTRLALALVDRLVGGTDPADPADRVDPAGPASRPGRRIHRAGEVPGGPPSSGAARRAVPTSVLDVGCGSGVLGIAALLLGATTLRAVDVDPEAAERTRANAADNAVADRVRVDTEALADLDGHHDLVVANILAPVLRALAHGLVARTAPGGHLVLSGFLDHQEPEVLAAMRAAADQQGRCVEVAARHVRDGWSAVALTVG